jgi:propionate CoA-transferase
VQAVEHRRFTGSYATQTGRKVLYVTERCVFQLTQDGMELVEIALMDARIFRVGPKGLREELLRIP